MTEGARLIAHAGATRIDREGLKSLTTPPGTESWRPIPHIELVDAITGELTHRGMVIRKEEFAIQREKLFGVMDLDWQDNGEYAAAVGLRHSNDKGMAATLVVASRVLVCDNLVFSSNLIPLKRKHTPGLNLRIAMIEAFDRFQWQFRRLQDDMQIWQDREIDERKAKQVVFDVFRQKIVPLRLFHPVIESYAVATKDQKGTAWSLLNSFTLHTKVLAPTPQFRATTKLAKYWESHF